ncbi:MAG TPA: hypothetical protein DGR97_09245 [Gammaproteobacteria bacterium]|nr:hypothetical protein [Gammaproteobacteria bacterium]|tara:strand:+ start:1439 stop:2281 length:843 start_codon:yes stop_codon:yes gene_type:complete
MPDDPNTDMDLEQQFGQLCLTLVRRGRSGSSDGIEEHSSNINWDQLGPAIFSQGLNQSLGHLIGAPLHKWLFGSVAGNNSSDNNEWCLTSPSEFKVIEDPSSLGLSLEESRRCEFAEVLQDQVNAANELSQQLTDVLERASARFQQSISDDKNDDYEITSLRELYDFWISIAEQTYAEKVMTVEYSQIFGRFINTSARMRKIAQELGVAGPQFASLGKRPEPASVSERQVDLQGKAHALTGTLLGDDDLTLLITRIKDFARKIDELREVVQTTSTPPNQL